MAPTRIKGQEVEILIVSNGVVEENITAIRSFEVAAKLETKEEGYLGETTQRYDEIFNGLRGRMEVHNVTRAVFDLMLKVVDRAKRRTPGFQINIKATFNFPDGDRPRVFIEDAFFGEIPFNAAGRADYVTASLDFQSSDISII